MGKIMEHFAGPWVYDPVTRQVHDANGMYIMFADANDDAEYNKKEEQVAILTATAPDMLQALINVRERLLEVLVAVEHPEIFIELNGAIKKATL